MSHEDKVEQAIGSSPVDPPGYIHHSAAVSDRGLRDENQDSFLIEDDLGLYVVADGVGGHQAGDVASAMATQVIRRVVAQWRAAPPRQRHGAPMLVNEAIETACAEIHKRATEDPRVAGMSTTVTMALIDGDRVVMGHVGDSRMYLLRDGALEQISTDHTLAAELYRGGVITREHIERHPHTHVLTRNCGSQSSVMVETLMLEVHPGDLVLLCSDGLNPALHPTEVVADALDSSADLAGALGALVERAKQGGSRDNITAVVWRRDGGDPPLTRPTLDALRSVPLLTHLSLADLAHLAAEMTLRRFDPDHVVTARGEKMGAMLVVLEGRLRWELADGHFAHLERGSDIGTTTLVAARRCPAELRAEVPTAVLELSTEAFRNFVRRRPRLGTELLTALADELSDWIDPDTDRGVARPPQGLLVEF